MPYINQAQRGEIDPHLERFLNAMQDRGLFTAGALNYCITRLLISVIRDSDPPEVKGYDLYNELMGVLECAKLEFYRREVAPYEDIKADRNGDLYG